MTTATDSLYEWVTRQRWFAGKGHHPRWRELTTTTVDVGAARIQTHFLMDDEGAAPTLYQVPTVERDQPREGAEPIGRGDDGSWVYDGPTDPLYVRELIRSIAPQLLDGLESSSVMTGEQSNTSIVLRFTDSPPVVCKVFRTLHDGENPDVTLQSALSAAGCPSVPRFAGRIAADWPDVGQRSGRAHGTLVFAQEFLEGAQDGWRLALRAATLAQDFTADARALGGATASVHLTLAEVMPTADSSDAAVAAIAATWQRRLDIAAREVPRVAALRAAIEPVYAAAATVDWPPLQRIHGDLHLGQVLLAPGRDWVLVDFEGEPLRPMNERDRPDCALRDVAGMLRSFDYVAGATPGWPTAWAAACRAAYLEGYAASAGVPPERFAPVLAAFELDKAVYEAIYEARNRPSWLDIPVTGIENIVL